MYTEEIQNLLAKKSRPLVFPRQFRKNIGRELQVKLPDGTEFSGNILDANDQIVTITREEIRKEGKKKFGKRLKLNYLIIRLKKLKLL
ncbi:MAG: hypothetical protein IPL42_14615 [Saprospiraceae bacterium]|nr:hypothetical protein [Saprospiraceae bacterium]